MTGLDPTTLADAGPEMAIAMGMRWDQDRPEIVRYVNKYRELLYTKYNDFSLFNDTSHCICVSNFWQSCVGCDNTYQAITLPEDITAVEGVWYLGRSLINRSSWREASHGIGSHGRRIETILMAEKFPTERDPKVLGRLKLYTEREEDHERQVVIVAEDIHGKRLKLMFKLEHDGWAISKCEVRKIISVALPSDRKGSVTLSDESGHTLSIYAPWESAPAYRRLKVATSCNCGDALLVRGVKKFQKIYFDHDIVEIGNSLIIEAAGNYFRNKENTTDNAQLKRALFDKAEFFDLLQGLIARHRGDSKNDGGLAAQARRPILRRKHLPTYRLH